MPAVGTHNVANYSIMDYSKETKTINLPIDDITAVSLPGLLTNMTAFETALDAVILGVRHKNTFAAKTVVTNTPPTDKDAQVETELLVRLQGATTEQPWSFRIPAVDYTAFNYADPPAGDQVILSGAGASAATTALISAIEDLVATPWDKTEDSVVVGMNVVR